MNMARENKRIYSEMENKLSDPQTKSKAEIWEPKTIKVGGLSSDIKYFVDELIVKLKKNAGHIAGSSWDIYNEADKKSVKLLFEDQNEAAELSHKLTAYKYAVISVIKPEEFADNPARQKDLIDFRNLLEKSILTDTDIPLLNNKAGDKKIDRISTYFQNTTALGALTILWKMQNDILYAENVVLNYFNVNTVTNFDGYVVYKPLVHQSSSSLKKGQLLEINAGIGAFSEAARSKITIGNKVIEPDDNGISTYSLKADKKPGKYYIPVTIEFIKPDGSIASITKNVEYIVSK